MKKKSKHLSRSKILFLLLFIFLMIFSCFILPPSFGKPKPFKKNGASDPQSIAEKKKIKIDNSDLGIQIRGQDKNKPVLLFLGGGPGIPQYLMEYSYPTEIEKNFVVCYLDYRGTGASYNKSLSEKEITTKRYLKDVDKITTYLQKRFKKNKIYLMGHSFGTYIGLLAVQKNPNPYYSFISMSQVTNSEQSEKIAYRYMLNKYKIDNNLKMVEKLKEYPIFRSKSAYEQYFNSSLRDKAMHDLGVGTTQKMRSIITGIFLPSLRCTVYSPLERINIWRGKAFLQKTPLEREVADFDAFSNVPEVDIPIYFFGGKHDQTCNYSLQEKYFKSIKAPVKSFYTFKVSAHSPLYEEPQKAMSILLKDIVNSKE